MSKIIDTSDLCDLVGLDDIDARVQAWQAMAEAEIVTFTGFDISQIDEKVLSQSQQLALKQFVAIAKIFIQETIRTLLFAPNYDNTRGLQAMSFQLQDIANELLKVEVI